MRRIWGIAFGGQCGVRNKLAWMHKNWLGMATYNLDGYLSDMRVTEKATIY
jgi:hypothetical protein